MLPIRNILKKLNSKHLFITEPCLEYNYAVSLFMGSKIGIYFKLEEDEIPEIIKIIFPILHKDDILNGAVMGHEFGHFLDLHYKLDITGKVIAKYMLNPIFEEIYKETMKKTSLSVTKEEFKVLLLKKYFKNWIQEFVADIIGICLYGLASFFAYQHVIFSNIKISMIGERHKISDNIFETHPRNTIRTFMMIKTLKKLKYNNYANKKTLDLIEEYYQIWNESIIENNNIIFILLEEFLKDESDFLIDSVINELKILSDNLIYDFSKLKVIVPHAVEKIINVIPPNEIKGEPIDEISILNAGWIAYLLEYDKIKETLNSEDYSFKDFEIKEIVDNLIKKAILASDIHSRWLNNEINS